MKWFKHMTDMAHDVRIKRVIRKYGIEGYGMYCYILERVVCRLDADSTVPDLEETSLDIATEFDMDVARVEEIMLFCIEQGLFEQDEITGRLTAHKVFKYLQSGQTKSAEFRKVIESESEKVSENLRPSQTFVKNRIDKIREDKDKSTASRSVKPEAAKPRKPPEMRDELENYIDSSFRAVFAYSAFGKERAAVKRLASKARAGGRDPTEAADAMMAAFRWLRENGERFWREQPHTPSALDSLWDRVVAAMESKTETVRVTDGAARFLEGKYGASIGPAVSS